MDDVSIKKIEELFKHHVGVMSKGFQHKLDLVIEGQHMLGEKFDRLETKLDRLEVKVDTLEVKVDVVVADLSAHRADTEAHHGVWRVKEG